MPRQLLFLPGPVTVAQSVTEALARPLIDHRGPEFAQLLGRITAALRPLFGARGDVIVLGNSGTGALETAIANTFSPGERVLSCGVGFFGDRFATIAKNYGCEVEVFETPLGSAVDLQALDDRLRRDGRREITGILLTHNETSTGVTNDMAALAPILRAHGALTLVDSISGVGASEFRMDEWGYDVVVTASQKAFAAPPGVAMIALSERAWERAGHARAPRFYFDLNASRNAARHGQMPWTPPISILFALDEALRRYHAEGPQTAYGRHARYAAAVRAALERLGFTILSQPDAHSPTVVAATPPADVDIAALLERLRERYGIVLSGGQGPLAGRIVRFGTMGDVGEKDILAAIAAIELTLLELDVAVTPGTGCAAAIELFGGRVTSGVA
ncbi:MAG: alanine--glyoxylate aminotransferase family protein [Candidatus Eremiobacteraeota bacterium]|nr:alanine--glyoxylate aminotransferase family protein [Candidatus Eremiobacteraeota bacterium]